jgi:hypothetical protein
MCELLEDGFVGVAVTRDGRDGNARVVFRRSDGDAG